MIGQLPIGRDLNALELARWQAFTRDYYGPITRNVKGALSLAELLAHAQEALDKAQIFDPIIWGKTRQAQLDSLLNQYNTLGRIIAGAETRRYSVRFIGDDFDIIFPGIHNEQVDADIYPSLGVPWIIPLTIAVVLVAAAVTTTKILNERATAQQLEYKQAILDADREMAKQAPDVRAKYGQWKKDNVELIRAAAAAPEGAGLLDRLLGAGTGAGIGALVGIGLAVWIVSRLPAKRTEAHEAAA